MEGEEPQIINTLASVRHSSKLNRSVDAPGQCYYCCSNCTYVWDEE